MSAPRSVVVMGVSGCGKSRLGEALARELGRDFIEGDALHSPEAVDKMRRGIPLDDADRAPWLARVGAALAEAAARGPGAVVACSALRRAYRDTLRHACPGLAFVHLHGSAELIAQRMAQRQGHYMPTSLLASQFAALEVPGADEPDVLPLPLALSPEELVRQALAGLR